MQSLLVLPALLQSSVLALLSTSIPLVATLTSTILVVGRSGEILINATAEQARRSSSVHVLAFSSSGELLLDESEGSFSTSIWEQVYDKAYWICRGIQADKADEKLRMRLDGEDDLETTLRQIMQDKAMEDQKWRRVLE